MSESAERIQIGPRIPRSLYEEMERTRTDSRTCFVINAIEGEIYGSEVAGINRQIERDETVMDGLVSELLALEETYDGTPIADTIRNRRLAVEHEYARSIYEHEQQRSEHIESHSDQRDEDFESLLVEVEQQLRGGEHVFPEHGKVERLATMDGSDSDTIIDLLKERNPDVPDHAFVPKPDADRFWSGVSEPERRAATDGGTTR